MKNKYFPVLKEHQPGVLYRIRQLTDNDCQKKEELVDSSFFLKINVF